MSFSYYLRPRPGRYVLRMSSRAPEGLSPQSILEAAWGFAITRILSTALDLDLFTSMARGHTTVEALTHDLSCSVRGLSMLLHALTALHYVETTPDGYALSPTAAAFLSKSSPHYIGAYVLHNTNESWSVWAQLSDVVRRGAPARGSVHGSEPDAEFFSRLVQSLHTMSVAAAATAAATFDDARRSEPRLVLDVGAGSAVWSLALAKQDARTRVTAIDLPPVLDRVTRSFVEREGATDRYTFWPGDFHAIDFGDSCFDVLILGHVCHGEGAEATRRLIERGFRALRAGGRLLIAEFVPDDDRTGPVMPLIFALHMLVLTEHGDTFTFAEYRNWMAAAGFSDVRTVAAPAPSPLILATK